jgi:hypothetical protein
MRATTALMAIPIEFPKNCPVMRNKIPFTVAPMTALMPIIPIRAKLLVLEVKLTARKTMARITIKLPVRMWARIIGKWELK